MQPALWPLLGYHLGRRCCLFQSTGTSRDLNISRFRTQGHITLSGHQLLSFPALDACAFSSASSPSFLTFSFFKPSIIVGRAKKLRSTGKQEPHIYAGFGLVQVQTNLQAGVSLYPPFLSTNHVLITSTVSFPLSNNHIFGSPSIHQPKTWVCLRIQYPKCHD